MSSYFSSEQLCYVIRSVIVNYPLSFFLLRTRLDGEKERRTLIVPRSPIDVSSVMAATGSAYNFETGNVYTRNRSGRFFSDRYEIQRDLKFLNRMLRYGLKINKSLREILL